MGLLQGVFDDLIVRLFLFVLIIFAFLRAYFFFCFISHYHPTPISSFLRSCYRAS